MWDEITGISLLLWKPEAECVNRVMAPSELHLFVPIPLCLPSTLTLDMTLWPYVLANRIELNMMQAEAWKSLIH